MCRKTSADTKTNAVLTPINEIAPHTGNAAREPKVPGATGEKPISLPVAKNIIVFCLTVFMGLYGCALSVLPEITPS
jgi:hypothetical protein